MGMQEKQLRVEERTVLEHERALKDLRTEVSLPSGSVRSEPSGCDVGRHIKLSPPFVERDVERYIPHFERAPTTLNWPGRVWFLLLQCVLVGKVGTFLGVAVSNLMFLQALQQQFHSSGSTFPEV